MEVDDKEINRMMWMVKGQLIPDSYSHKDRVSMYNSYFKRVWYNNEASDEGFEKAWSNKNKDN